ncbi:zinc carboxypeptidase-like [Teleopsis dalmanni]|uniref:zinc carboxypeptidase-like n=1 Tax=Teleopsis dalmanni TaxID=139649 RepID=UPI0018CF6796|nr:zinc carboxypeptidase-like [Teleopsis dalmanni]
MKTFLFLIGIITAVCVVSATTNTDSAKRYENYQVFKIKLQNDLQRKIVKELLKNSKHYDLWHSSGTEVHIMISPNVIQQFMRLVKLWGITTEKIVSNVQSLINAEINDNIQKIDDTVTLDWTRYYPLADIECWLDEVLKTYPLITERFTVGKSYEGRTINGIKISYKAGNPGIFIESNIHAREWITSATATWFINELLTSTKAEVRQLAENYDWYIVPVLNVDGFVYTHEKDRLWRKTRQPVSTSTCIGADPNRNFDSHWMENGGASDDPCASDYAGPYPFSEPEIKGLTDFISGIKSKINILLAFHSYSQVLLSPYGHSEEELPPNYDDLMSVAKAYVDAVAGTSYATNYEYGTSAGVLYTASGTTIDWAYNEQDIKLTYTIEFRDLGRYGFVLPPVNIIPNAEETLNGILALVKRATELEYLNTKY